MCVCRDGVCLDWDFRHRFVYLRCLFLFPLGFLCFALSFFCAALHRSQPCNLRCDDSFSLCPGIFAKPFVADHAMQEEAKGARETPGHEPKRGKPAQPTEVNKKRESTPSRAQERSETRQKGEITQHHLIPISPPSSPNPASLPHWPPPVRPRAQSSRSPCSSVSCCISPAISPSRAISPSLRRSGCEWECDRGW